MLVLVFLQGTLSFAVGSILIARALSEATEAPTLGGAYATVASNIGAAIGPWLGGVAIGSAHDYTAPLWVSVILAALALLGAGCARAVCALSEFRRRRIPA